MSSFPVIVIGHVDHGKTALVQALTGTDTDTLEEEKARGISIALGFASMSRNDKVIDLIDAPGHERFIGKMIAGASGAQAALIVISMTDGIQAQTREHIQFAELLGIDRAVIALSKSDLVSERACAARIASIKTELRGSVFANASIVPCAAHTGDGLHKLTAALRHICEQPTNAQCPDATYFPIDRAFHREGHGTVVTGTLQGASIRAEDKLNLASNGKTITVRGIQTRGQSVSTANVGGRTALNLRGVSSDGIRAGDILYTSGAYTPSLYCDIRVSLPKNGDFPIKHMQEVRALFATTQRIARISLYGAKTLQPGTSGYAQLRFAAPVIMYVGQRTILRRLSPVATIGGAIILEPQATFAKARNTKRLQTLEALQCGDLTQIGKCLSAENGGITTLREMNRLSRASEEKIHAVLATSFTQIDDENVSPNQTIAELENTYLARLSSFHTAQATELAAPREALIDKHISSVLLRYIEAKLTLNQHIRIYENGVALSAHDPIHNLTKTQRADMAHMLATLEAAKTTPPPRDALISHISDGEALLALLVHSGRAIALYNISLKQTLVFAASEVDRAAQLLRETYPEQATFTTGEARATLSTTRKYIVPLLEHFDVTGITIRNGNSRHIA